MPPTRLHQTSGTPAFRETSHSRPPLRRTVSFSVEKTLAEMFTSKSSRPPPRFKSEKYSSGFGKFS